MFAEDNLLPLSALQHLLFCERQCALIHIEQTWVENIYTAEGRILHQHVDSGRNESRGDIRIAFTVPLRSLRLGIVGKADVVEFHKTTAPGKDDIIWRPFPVEYKRGRKKKQDWDRVQLCAQAICLEEMIGIDVPQGALFYGKTRRRLEVLFDEKLRNKTEDTAVRLHQLVENGRTPPPIYSEVCPNCSFVDICLPKGVSGRKSVNQYVKEVIENN
jgi:CRISPR-associated exonuclease Cas4